MTGATAIKTALSKGPVISTMEVFSDLWFSEAEKIYIPMAGSSLGHYAVKIVGFINDQSGGYWKVVMPFDETLGKKGIVWIRAGLNIGDIEVNAYAVNIAAAGDIAIADVPSSASV